MSEDIKKDEALEDLEPENGDEVKGGDRATDTVNRARQFTKNTLEREGIRTDKL